MDNKDQQKIQEKLELICSRTASMNKHAVSANTCVTQIVRERGEITPDTRAKIEHHMTRYEQEKDKLEQHILMLDQLINP